MSTSAPSMSQGMQDVLVPILQRAMGNGADPLGVAVCNMISFDQQSWGPLAAAALIVTLPVLLLTVFAQRQIVAGLTAGAVKGG
jgi:multiple sugar transport system permease protein